MSFSIDIGLVGLGSMNKEVSTIYRNNLISDRELAQLKSAGAAGEICGKHYDIHGNILDVDFNKRTVSIQIEKLADFDTVIGVAGGKAKTEAILGAIRGGLVNVLVTDSDPARALLDMGSST